MFCFLNIENNLKKLNKMDNNYLTVGSSGDHLQLQSNFAAEKGQAWAEKGKERASTPVKAKPQAYSLDSENKIKKFDYNIFVKRQLAALFSNDKSLKNVVSKSRQKFNPNEMVVTLEQLDAEEIPGDNLPINVDKEQNGVETYKFKI